VALDPLSESAQRRLLTLLWRHGGRDAALVRADALVDMLRQELDAAPEPATQKLIAAIRSDRGGSTPAAPAAPRPAAAPTDRAALVMVASSKPGPPETPEQSNPGPAPPSRFRPRRVAVLTAVAALAAVLVLAGRPWSAAPTREPQPTAGPSWTPPGMLANLPTDRRALGANGISALVVLPFTAVPNADGGGADRRLADLISDDLVSDLSRVPGVRVIARQTARLYAGRSVDVGAIGADLGVRYVIDGNVQLQDRTLRIEATLVDATNRLTVWSQRFERGYDERFSAHDAIIRAVARALQLGVIDAEDRRRPPARNNPQVDELLARGWSAMVSLPTQGAASAADRYFTAVLERDPDNVSALMGLGGYHAGLVIMFLAPDPEEHLARAAPLLQRATAISPSSPMARYYVGLVQKARGQYEDALRTFTTVVEQNPSFPLAYAQVGHLVARLGRPEEAMEYIRYAVRLNPRDPNIGLIGMMAGEVELELGHDAAALDWLRQSLAYAPINPFAHAAMGAALALTNDAQAAAAEAQEVRRLAPWLTLDRMIARLVATSVPGHEPERLIAGLRRVFGPTP
jgi:TolB-like protein